MHPGTDDPTTDAPGTDALTTDALMIDDLAPLREALGDLLTARRNAAGLTQRQLSHRVNYARSTVGGAEGGHRVPAESFWTRCDQLLGARGELLRAYHQLAAARTGNKQRRDRFEQARREARCRDVRHDGSLLPSLVQRLDTTEGAAEPPKEALASSAVAAPRPVGTAEPQARLDPGSQPKPYAAPIVEMVDYLDQQWHVLVRADNLLGPAHALAAVRGQVGLIERLLAQDATGWQTRLWRLGAQYAESTAWLFEDIGHHATAVSWTSRALEWAHAADDPLMVSWALFRRSQQAAAERDAAGTVALARAAGREPGRLTAPMRAAITSQQAHGAALAGDEHGALNQLDEAVEFASPADGSGDAAHGHGSFCTAEYLQMQRANCWMMLGRPDRAAPGYQQALAGLPPAYHRDRGHGLARLGRALAATGEVEEAAQRSMEALRIGVGTGSGRIVNEVRLSARQLAAHAAVPAVTALVDAVRQLEPAA